MIVNITGEINPYYVQTLCMVFFPGAKFAHDEPADAYVPVLDLHVYDGEDNTVCAHAALRYDGKRTEGNSSVPYIPSYSVEKRRKIAAGKAIFEAGKSLLRYTPPWGILTGVRPSKVAAELLRAGNTPTKAKRTLRDEYPLNPQKASLAVSVADLELDLTTPDQTGRCSVYVSIPFCPSRCSYCSFVSYTTPRLLSMIDDYLDVLIRDLADRFAIIRELGLTVATVYIGGGTPTILSAAQLDKLLAAISSFVDPSSLEEFTLEGGRPDTITKEKMQVCLSYGVNRISVNPQTLNDTLLENIGRHHTVAEFLEAYGVVKESGIPYVNVDLIAGLPGDSFANFSSTLDRIVELEPENITVHTFCVKKAAELPKKGGNGIYSRHGGETAKAVSYAKVTTALAGYRPYYLYRQKNTIGNLENVGYSKPGAEGMYNIYMMEELHSIFAAGAGAVSKLVAPAKDFQTPKIQRIFTPKYPYEYLRDAEADRTFESPSLRDQALAFYQTYVF